LTGRRTTTLVQSAEATGYAAVAARQLDSMNIKEVDGTYTTGPGAVPPAQVLQNRAALVA